MSEESRCYVDKNTIWLFCHPGWQVTWTWACIWHGNIKCFQQCHRCSERLKLQLLLQSEELDLNLKIKCVTSKNKLVKIDHWSPLNSTKLINELTLFNILQGAHHRLFELRECWYALVVIVPVLEHDWYFRKMKYSKTDTDVVRLQYEILH